MVSGIRLHRGCRGIAQGSRSIGTGDQRLSAVAEREGERYTVYEKMDREILADLYLSRNGMDFLSELVESYGARFGGSEEERAAANFLVEQFEQAGADAAWTEAFPCTSWKRKSTTLVATEPESKAFDCIALPYCPPGQIEAPLVFLGDGHPQAYEENLEEMQDAIVMVTTATPKFYHRTMHRGEKLGRAIEAGAAGFIWMRGEPGGLPETGSARFGRACEIPAISVSYEVGHEILRLSKNGELRLKIESDNEIFETESLNAVAELRASDDNPEHIVVGAHYDGHDISQSAADDGAGTAVLLEALRALAPHKHNLKRTIRFVGFAQEEMGLMGAEDYAGKHVDDEIRFMLNLDGAGRGEKVSFVLQGWPETMEYFRDMAREMFETDISVGDSPSLYSDMYPFSARGIPSATLRSTPPATSGAPRGYGHTYWDSLDKINPRYIQGDAARVARMLLRLCTQESLPFTYKEPAEIGALLTEMGFDKVLRYEGRPVPGE